MENENNNNQTFTEENQMMYEENQMMSEEDQMMSEEDQMMYEEKLKKKKIRKQIETEVGDTESLLGTTADATQLMLYLSAFLITSISNSNSLKELQNNTKEYLPFASNFLNKIERGEIELTIMQKGIQNVVGDIESRSTKITKILKGDNNAK